MFKYLQSIILILSLIPIYLHAQLDPQTEKRVANLELELLGAKDMLKQKTEELDLVQDHYSQLKSLMDLRGFKPKYLKKTNHPQLNMNVFSLVNFKEKRKGSFQKVDLRKKIGKKVFLLNLWATWCVPCVSPEEQAFVRYLEHQLKAIGVEVIAMAVDEFDRLSQTPEKWYYPIYHLKNAPLELFSQDFVEAIGLILPLFILVSEQGEILYYADRALNDQIVSEIKLAMVYHKLGL